MKHRTLLDDKLDEAARRHQNELKMEKERVKLEQEEFKAAFIRTQKEQMQDFQRKLREDSIKERNKEIAAIIERLGDETHDTQKQITQQNDKRVREIELKWKHDVEEYKALVSQWKEKFNAEGETRRMLDDNLRVLGRRVAELELEVSNA